MSSPNAFKALEELKMEIANELSINNSQTNLGKNKSPAAGGAITSNIAGMGQKRLIKKE